MNRNTILKIAGILIGAGAVVILCLYLSIRWGLFGPLPSRSELKAIKSYESSELYAMDGELLGKYFIFDHSQVSLEEISPLVIDALLSIEDIRFYKHHGTDYRSMVRVLVKTIILRQKSAGGGSTITSQLAKNLYPRRNGGRLTLVIEKIKEGIIAGRLERVYSKDEILLLYFNTVSFGENVYGIGAGAQRFFNKAPHELNIQEAATLVGLLKANTAYNPRLFPEKAIERRNLVIGQMNNYDFISREMADSLRALPLELNHTPLTHIHGLAPYFREMLRMELRQWLEHYNAIHGTAYNLYQDGLKIYSTIDYTLQRIAEEAVAEQMIHLQGQVDRHYQTARKPRVQHIIENQLRMTARYRALSATGIDETEIFKQLSQPEDIDFFSWKELQSLHISASDSVFMAQKLLHQGLVSIDPATGYVHAWVGGNDIRFFQFDHVLSSRQVGSAFKPFVYAAALESGIDPCQFVSNEQFVVQAYDNWSPVNHDNHYGGYYSMPGALAHSVNIVSARYMMQTGATQVAKLAHDAGITGYLPEVPSLALGTAEASLLDMTAAYAMFANNGRAVRPKWLLLIKDKFGKVLYEAPQIKAGETVIDPETAMLMTEMLKGVANFGTAGSLRWQYGIDFDIAGKTGTTQNNSDGWFIGFTPGLVTGVWTGLQNPAFNIVYPLPFGSSGSAVPIWGTFMKKVSMNDEVGYYTASHFRELPPDLKEKLDCAMYLDELPRQPWLRRILGIGVEADKDKESMESKDGQPQEKRQRKGLLRRILDDIF